MAVPVPLQGALQVYHLQHPSDSTACKHTQTQLQNRSILESPRQVSSRYMKSGSKQLS